MDATIVIPVKNGGSRLVEVLEAIKNQETEYKYETVIVDSGSTDDSLETAKRYDVILSEIKPSEFGHGKTRNYGASLGTGRYIIFLTQDALPASSSWIDTLIRAMDESNAAGGFGRHLPYPECNMMDQKMLFFHFLRFGGEDRLYHEFKLEEKDKKRFEEDDDFEQYMTFFSDNCSILRRSVWEEIPYQDVKFAEDQVWAKEIIERGMTKIYIPTGAVYHSHNYPLQEYRKRYFDDFKAMYSVHGYNMCPDRKVFFKVWIENSLSDGKYALKHGHFGTKLYWMLYAFRRNYIRNKASCEAVKYFSLDEAGKKKMDELYSQQLKQRG